MLNREDTKAFIIGFSAGLIAIIFWDIIKKEYEIFNFRNNEKN